MLAEGSAARRKQPQAVKELEKEIANDGREQVIERLAYTWFNRFSALRFMDANGYTSIRVVSPADVPLFRSRRPVHKTVGKSRSTVVPTPGSLEIAIVPPTISMNARTCGSPNPVP
mgnify:CR=1 FL=1